MTVDYRDKVVKLLTKATDSGATAAESASYRAKAHEIAAAHGIDLSVPLTRTIPLRVRVPFTASFDDLMSNYSVRQRPRRRTPKPSQPTAQRVRTQPDPAATKRARRDEERALQAEQERIQQENARRERQQQAQRQRVIRELRKGRDCDNDRKHGYTVGGRYRPASVYALVSLDGWAGQRGEYLCRTCAASPAPGVRIQILATRATPA